MFDYVFSMGIILTVVIVGFSLLIVAGVVGGLVMNGMKNRAVLAHGESAPAVILKSWQTGTVMNNINPQIGLLIEVRPANRPAYQAETKMFIPMMQIPQFQPGAVLQVKYDPKEPRKVAVDSIGGSMGAAPAAEQADPARVQALPQRRRRRQRDRQLPAGQDRLGQVRSKRRDEGHPRSFLSDAHRLSRNKIETGFSLRKREKPVFNFTTLSHSFGKTTSSLPASLS